MVGDFVLAFALLGGGLLALLLRSAKKDREDAKVKAAQACEQQAAAQEEARKFRAGASLVCLSCGTHFPSPLTDAGCPECHLSVLVMTDVQFRKMEAGNEK